MNSLFTPTENESFLIKKIQDKDVLDYALIRMTETMIEKSIIDASQIFRDILEDAGLISYDEIDQGQKIISKTLILTNDGWIEEKCSFYRPMTKSGDPRFWVYNFKKYVEIGDLIYFAVKDHSLITIPLNSYKGSYTTLTNLESDIKINTQTNLEYKIDRFGNEVLKKEKLSANLVTLIDNIKELKKYNWIPSVGKERPADKDVGETLESILNIPTNSLKTPDFLGEIELKCKRSKSKTRNNLFAQVPNWGISKYSRAVDYLINYGIESEKHPGYKTLYVTVKAQPPNQQGFYFNLNHGLGQLNQNKIFNNEVEKMCSWEFVKLKERLHEKHPKTLWIEAEETKIEGKVHFKYNKIKLTQKPIFSSFINLISNSEISMDWTHRCLPDGTKYNDHGFLFKIPTGSRSKLFSSTEEIEI